MRELCAQREPDAASKAGEAFVDYSKSAAQNVADMAAAAKQGATRAANKAQPYVDSAAQQASRKPPTSLLRENTFSP